MFRLYNGLNYICDSFYDNILYVIWLQVPAVPLIYALRNALFLETPSPSQQQFAKSAEEERSHVSELELKMLLNMTKRSSTEDEAGDSAQADDVSTYNIIKDLKKDAARRNTEVKDRVQFKRKRAKVLVFYVIFIR